MPKVLIVKFGAIGDVIMALPAAHAMYRKGVEIDWVCGATVAPLLACYPWIRTIVADERSILKGSISQRFKALIGLWQQIAGKKYDLCATLYYDGRYRLVTLPVRAGQTLMLSKTERAMRLLPGRHHTDEYARILLGLKDEERSVGLAPVHPEGLPDSPLAKAEGEIRIVLAPGGARNMMRDDALRRWPAERYAELAQRLIAKGFRLILIGGPEDGWVVPLFGGLNAENLIAKLSLPQTLALLNESDVLVTHDTGPLHLAGVTQVGIVSVFGPTDPRGRLPQRANAIAIWGGEGFACRPCYDGQEFASCNDNICMKQVTVGMVLAEVVAIVDQRRNGAKPPRIASPVSTVAAGL